LFRPEEWDKLVEHYEAWWLWAKHYDMPKSGTGRYLHYALK